MSLETERDRDRETETDRERETERERERLRRREVMIFQFPWVSDQMRVLTESDLRRLLSLCAINFPFTKFYFPTTVDIQYYINSMCTI